MTTHELSLPVGSGTRRRSWRWARATSALAILLVVEWRVGTGPFLSGLRKVDVWSLVAASAIAVVTTVCCAWRWRVVAAGLGVEVPLRQAVAAYYRSQFLNMTLPGGVLGDVHRAVDHGRAVGDVRTSARAVAWERASGQVVQIAITLCVLLAFPSPLRSWVPALVASTGLVVVALLVVARVRPDRASSGWRRISGVAASDVRRGVLARRSWPVVLVASAVVVLGHAASFVVAARTAGVDASPGRMLPLALVVLLAMSVPANVGGWGVREGVAAWVFATAGLGADAGVATAVVYGVMVLVACLPGAVLLLVGEARQGRPSSVTGHRAESTDASVAEALRGADA